MKKRFVLPVPSISFYIFWSILLVGKGLGFTNIDTAFQYMVIIAILFVAIKLLTSKWTQMELFTCISLNVLGILVWINSKDASVLLTMLSITACKDINLHKVLKLSFWIKGIMFFAVTSLAILGITDIQLAPRYYSSSIYDIRYALGYSQPNATQYTLFIIIVLALLCYHKRMNILHYMALLLYSLFIFRYTNSRAGIAMSVIVLFFAYVADRKGGFVLRKTVKFVGEYAYVFGAGISFAICYLFYKIPILNSFGTLSSRFRTGSNALINNSISLFGAPNIITDFGYINILYSSGILFFVFFIVAMTKLNKEFIKRNMYIETIVLIIYAVYSLVEAYTSSILMNVSLLFISWLIYPKSKGAFEF